MSNSCCYCSSTERELRPYGPNGEWVCFSCAMSTPERRKQSERNYESQLNACGPVAIIGETTGPRPMEKGTQ